MEIRARLEKEAREKERGKRAGRTVALPERDESDESRSSSPTPASASASTSTSPAAKQSDRRRALDSRKADTLDAKFNGNYYIFI